MSALPTPEQELAYGESILDPVLFARNILNTEPWAIQEAILRSIEQNRRTSIKACHASGKTLVLALAALHWVAKYEQGVVIVTSASALQVTKGVFGEIHGLIEKSTGTYPWPDPLQTHIQFNSGRYVIGFSTSATDRDAGVRFQGLRSRSGHTLVLADEAIALSENHWTAIESLLAGGAHNRLVIAGNPTVGHAGQYYYDAFHKNRAQFKCFTISSFDTPNLLGLNLESLLQLPDAELDNNPIPFLTTRRWVKERYDAWTDQSPQFQSRVLGQFPEQGDGALIGLSYLENARTSDADVPNAPVRGGLDCAAGGMSESVLVLRRACRILLIKAWNLPNPIPAVIATLRPYMERGLLESLNVDSVGVGHGYVQMLIDAGIPVVGVNVGLPAADSERHFNAKAQYYWALKDRFEANDVSGLEDEITIGQLSSIAYRLTPRGQVQIVGKDEMKSRLGRGAKLDRAEAVMLAFSETGAGGAIYARSFISNDDLVFDPRTMPLGWGMPGSYVERTISIAHGSAKPFVMLELLDDGKLIYVAREYFADGAAAPEPKTDAKHAEALDQWSAGRNAETGEVVPRDRPRDGVVLLDREHVNFAQEVWNLGFCLNWANIDLLQGIQMVGTLFDRKLVRVSSDCKHFLEEHRNFRWDRQKLARGIEQPIDVGRSQTVTAFRNYVRTRLDPYRLMEDQ